MTLNDMMRDPRMVAARAARLDIIACEYRAQAARLRLQVIEWELAGDPVRASEFALRAEIAASDAAAIEAKRAELIGRFASSMTLDLTADEGGVYA
jgi:hypothetical protein